MGEITEVSYGVQVVGTSLRSGLRRRAWYEMVTLAATTLFGGTTLILANDSNYDYTTSVDLGSQEYRGVHSTIECASSGTTDNLIFSVFSSLDNTYFDTIPLYSVEVTATSGASIQLSVMFDSLPSYIKFAVRNAAVAGAGTDTFNYAIKYRPFR